MKTIIFTVIALVFLAACSTTHTVSITTKDGTSTFTETATTSMRPVKAE